MKKLLFVNHLCEKASLHTMADTDAIDAAIDNAVMTIRCATFRQHIADMERVHTALRDLYRANLITGPQGFALAMAADVLQQKINSMKNTLNTAERLMVIIDDDDDADDDDEYATILRDGSAERSESGDGGGSADSAEVRANRARSSPY